MDPKTYEQQQPLIAQIPQVPLLPQHIITSGTRKDCIRLRGLLYEAQVEHILEFLGEHAKNIVFQGVHMVYNAQVSDYFFTRLLSTILFCMESLFWRWLALNSTRFICISMT